MIVTQLADPQWKARWINRDDTSNTEPEIRPAFRKASRVNRLAVH